MFEFLYAGQLMQLIRENPREFVIALTASYVVSEITSTKKEAIKANAKIRVAELEKETAQLKLETAKLFEVTDTPQQ